MSNSFAYCLLLIACIATSSLAYRQLPRPVSNNRYKKVIKMSSENNYASKVPMFVMPLIPVALATQPAVADAFTSSATALNSAFAAYGHYLGLVLVSMSLISERLLIKPNMTQSEEDKVVIADSIYGIAGVLVLVSGYFRLTQYGKGWEFYSHEPIFWVKMLLFSIMGSSSLFPTIKLVQRAIVAKNFKDGKITEAPAPMTEALANRIIKVVNGELLAICSIPLAATLMSRGVGHVDGFPWQAGAAVVAVATVGLGFKYVKEAVEWKD